MPLRHSPVKIRLARPTRKPTLASAGLTDQVESRLPCPPSSPGDVPEKPEKTAARSVRSLESLHELSGRDFLLRSLDSTVKVCFFWVFAAYPAEPNRPQRLSPLTPPSSLRPHAAAPSGQLKADARDNPANGLRLFC